MQIGKTRETIVSKELIKLLSIFGCESKDFDEIVDFTQKHWLRLENQERWDMNEIAAKYSTNEILKLLKEIRMVDEIRPQDKEYDSVLILGALAPRMAMRLSYALKLWEKGLRFKNLVFLAGQRPLIAERELEVLKDPSQFDLNINDEPPSDLAPKTEFEIIKAIVKRVKLPEDFKEKVTIKFINAAMRENKDGSLKRPTNMETLKEWAEQNTKPCSCLLVSNQPFILAAHQAALLALDKGYKIDSCGKSCSDSTKISVQLDSLARTLYTEKLRHKKKQDCA
ncbi:Uncharacterized protein AB751O23_BY_00010 [Chlamydiales bacterium SCGC AB-751-O23]|nr:Uncharacterized protein AB751O23_BY_00010 [Chlamydiales bacterium SCGC AB-751-O23]